LEIHLEDAVPLVEGHLFGGPLPQPLGDVDSRVVQQYVDAPKALARLANQPLDARQLRDVGGAGPGAATLPIDLGRRGFAGRRVDLRDHDPCAFFGEASRVRSADAVAGPRDDGHAVLQSHSYPDSSPGETVSAG